MAENRNPQPSSYVQSSPGNGYKHSRVTSTVAQSFAADLDSMFGLSTGGPSGGLETLSQTVEEKYNISLPLITTGVNIDQYTIQERESLLRPD